MKKTVLIFLALLILPVIMAQELEPEVTAGITPDAGFFYSIDVWWDKVRINLATNATEKARIRIEIAEERASELRMMAMQNKMQAMERARMEERKQIEEIEDLQGELTDDEKVHVQQMLQKHIIVLERVREQVPEQAYRGIDNALNNSKRVFENNQKRIPEDKRETVSEIEEKIKKGQVRIRREAGHPRYSRGVINIRR